MYPGERPADQPRQALALVHQDPGLRALFVAEYAGDGDALDALREFVEELAPHERTPTELADETARQRALFGRPLPDGDDQSNEAREAIADGARLRAERIEALGVAIAAVIEADRARAIVAEPTRVTTGVPTGAIEAAATSLRRRVPLWIVASMIACFALGLLVATAVGRSAPPAPVAIALPHDTAASPAPGDPTAARDWFAGSQKGMPVFPYPGDLRTLGVAANSIRFIQADQTGSRLWIGRTTADFCLLWTSSVLGSPTMETSCGTPSAFAHAALTISTSKTRYVWNGATVTITSLPQ